VYVWAKEVRLGVGLKLNWTLVRLSIWFSPNYARDQLPRYPSATLGRDRDMACNQ
jgi:hypothetical protein